VSVIRPLEPEDIPGVAALYERVMRSGARTAEPAVEDFFRQVVLLQPWADPDVPSLVYDDPEAGVLGFLGSHVRRLLLDGKRVRVGCSGQLVADPDAAKPGVGALLMRAHMRGAQEVSSTDGATSTVRDMWQRLGGQTLPLASIGWTRVLRPARFAAAIAGRHREHEPQRSAAVLDVLAAPITRRALRPSQPEGSTEPLTSELLLELVELGSWRLRPDYDAPYLDWLFARMAEVPGRGDLRRLAVRDERGQPLGWAVYYRSPGGISQVQQIAALGDPGPVVDHVFWDASLDRSAAVQGRLEPALVPPLLDRRCVFRRTEWALVRTGHTELLATIAAPDSLLTRMDGEWWMGPHLLPAAAAA
jgi:hypothetical protein